MFDLIVSRRSIRQWNQQPVVEQDVHDLLEAAMSAPSAMNQQAWQFVVLEGELLQRVLEVNSNTPKGAPVAILVCEDRRAEKAAGFAVQDCSAATQNILLAAHAKGLGAVWTAVYTQPTRVTELVGLPSGVVPFAIIPIGHPLAHPSKPKSRFDSNKVHAGRW